MPGDGEGRPLVLQLPHVVGEPRSRLMAVAEVAFVPGYPVSDGAVGDASVGFLRASGELGHLCTIDDALGHAVAGDGTRGGRWTSLDASFARCFAIF